MSIFSSIGSAISNAYSSAKSAISSAFTSHNNSQSANAYTAASTLRSSVPQASLVPNISTPQGKGQALPNGQVVILNPNNTPTGTILGGGVSSSVNPNPIYSAPVTLRGGSTPTGGFSTSSVGGSAIAPTTLTAPQGGATSSPSITTASTAPSTPITLPSKPSLPNVGTVNSSALLASMGNHGFTYDAKTNSFIPSQTENTDGATPQNKILDQIHQKLIEGIPQKDSVYQDPSVIAAQQEVNQRKQEVANYTAQLNAITAKQNQDLLTVRGTDSKEGVTQAVYGGQEAEINREAAIKALPVQAQISASQGNLQLAQDYLTQLTTFTQERINNDYTHNTNVYNAIKGYADASEKKVLDKQQTALDDAKKRADENIKTLHEYMLKAAESGQTGSISRLASLANSVADPNFTQMLGSVVASTPGIVKSTNSVTSLTKSDIQTGATKAGVSVTEFTKLPADVQNYYANSPASKLKVIDDAISNVASGSEKADDVKKEIDQSSNPQSVKDYLKAQVDAVAPKDSGGGFWSKIANFF